MTRSLLALASAAILFALVPTAMAQSAQTAQDASVPAEGLDWHPFEKAIEVARDTDKMIIVDVYAPWCPWCRRLQREVYTDEHVRDYIDEHFVLTRLDAENQEDSLHFREYVLTPAELSAGLGAQGFPTTVFLNAQTEYITRLPGFLEADDFLHVLDYVGSEAFMKQTFEEFTEERSGSGSKDGSR